MEQVARGMRQEACGKMHEQELGVRCMRQKVGGKSKDKRRDRELEV